MSGRSSMISSGSSARFSVGTMVAPSASASWNWAGVVSISGRWHSSGHTWRSEAMLGSSRSSGRSNSGRSPMSGK